MNDAASAKRVAWGWTLAFIGSFAFSAKAILVKLAYQHPVDALTLITLRMLIALPLFTGLAWWAGRGQAQLTSRDWLAVLGLGFSGYYLSSLLDFAGLQYISASLERLIFYLSPTIVLVLGFVLHKRAIKPLHLAGMAVSYAGIVLVFVRELNAGESNLPLGSALVFGSAFFYSIYLVFSARLIPRLGSLRLVGLATSVACVFCIVHFLLVRAVDTLWVGQKVLWLAFLNATVGTAVPVILMMLAIERIGAASAAQVGMVGPLMTVALASCFLGETVTSEMVAGTGLVLCGIFVFSRAER